MSNDNNNQVHYTDAYPTATCNMTTQELLNEATRLENFLELSNGAIAGGTRNDRIRYGFVRAELLNR